MLRHGYSEGTPAMAETSTPPNAETTDPSPEGRFRAKVIPAKHDLVDPCFMTGKGCVYTQIIEEETVRGLQSRGRG
jgi:hypothetical protein